MTLHYYQDIPNHLEARDGIFRTRFCDKHYSSWIDHGGERIWFSSVESASDLMCDVLFCGKPMLWLERENQLSLRLCRVSRTANDS